MEGLRGDIDGRDSTDEEEDVGGDKYMHDSDATVTYPIPTSPGLPWFMPGDIVRVSPRTWPGVNKPGGVGKVLSVDETTATATVEYVIGRKRMESRVPFEFMEEYNLGPRERRGG
jgi:hypothetical protein